MLVYKIVSLIFWLLIIPFCMGLLSLPLLDRRHRTPGVALLGGYILQFTLLEIVGIPVVLLAVYHGFSTFIKWYTPFLVIFALAGIWVTYLKMRKGYEPKRNNRGEPLLLVVIFSAAGISALYGIYQSLL